jgi:hypothetical protein
MPFVLRCALMVLGPGTTSIVGALKISPEECNLV